MLALYSVLFLYIFVRVAVAIAWNLPQNSSKLGRLIVFNHFFQGKDVMRKLRCARSKSSKPNINDNALCNGPSKLCVALAITKEHLNKENLTTSDKIWIERDENFK